MLDGTVMGKQKQKAISSYLGPKLKPSTIPRKISSTVAYSPLKRLRTSQLISSCSKSECSHNPTSLYTPLELQVAELKAKYPDVLLMIEVGYKFRFFGEDAENAARVLGIFAHMDHNFLTASIPTFRFNVHVRRLVSAGYKVGVVKQTETATIKAHGSNKLGPFCRDLSALYTKATIEAAQDVGGEGPGCCNNYLVCVVDNGDHGGTHDVRIGIVAVEVSTGDVIYGEFDDNLLRTGLEAKILSLSPAELLLGHPLSKQTEKFLVAYAGPASNVRLEHAPRDGYTLGGALNQVLSFYDKIGNTTSIGESAEGKTNNQLAIMGMPDLVVQALAMTVNHLKQFGLERILCLEDSFRPFSNNVEMTLSANAMQQLEVLKNNTNGSEFGSLFQCMNHTLTTCGSRLLRHWVSHPLRDRNMINARLDAISEILESITSPNAYGAGLGSNARDTNTNFSPKFHQLLTSVLTNLGRLPDIQRGITRIFHRTATASEFIAVIEAILESGKQLRVGEKSISSSLLRRLTLTASSSSIISTASRLLSALNKEAAEQRDLCNLFVVSEGQFEEISTASKKAEQAKEKLDVLIDLCRKQLKNQNLEFMSVSGTTHLIELPLDVKAPSNWVKVNSTKKAIRYHAPEVLVALDHMSLANEELLVVCRSAWHHFLNEFSKYYSEFQSVVQALAALDCLHSLALLARNKQNYVRPVFVDDSEPVQICISSGRHPVLETMLQDSFIPNDTSLHADGEYCQIVTGPNMGGKSCYIRQVALIAIMAQVGSFVPASSTRLHVLDGIYTRMGASDSIQQGRSTFLEELGEASHILHTCTAQSLVIFDELGRGTGTHDGVAIAYATLQYLLDQKKCMLLFVTHYPEIVSLTKGFTGRMGEYHVTYLTSQKDESIMNKQGHSHDYEDIVYLYKLVPGVSARSFGFQVAQLAQIPLSCMNRAKEMVMKFEHAIGGKKLQESEEDGDLKNIFSNLNLAFSEDVDPARRLQFLKHARNLALQLEKW